MDDEGGGEDAVENGVGGARSDGCGTHQGDECGREETLKGPVVRAVGPGGLGEWCGLVRPAAKDGWIPCLVESDNCG